MAPVASTGNAGDGEAGAYARMGNLIVRRFRAVTAAGRGAHVP